MVRLLPIDSSVPPSVRVAPLKSGAKRIVSAGPDGAASAIASRNDTPPTVIPSLSSAAVVTSIQLRVVSA